MESARRQTKDNMVEAIPVSIMSYREFVYVETTLFDKHYH